MSDRSNTTARPSPPGIPEALKTEDMLATDQWLAYVRARDNGHIKFVEDAKQFERFYYGEQWDEETLKKLDGEKRPHITVNLILTTVNAVVGEYIGQRQDIVFRARSRGAQEGTAQALTKLAKVVTDDSHSRWAEKRMFEDGIIQDRGFMEVCLDFGENMDGEIRETALDPVDVLLDPGGREYDPRTWSEVFVTRWMTPDEVAAKWGRDQADKITYCSEGSTFGFDSVSFYPETFSQDKQYYTNAPAVSPLYQDEWKRVHRVRVIQRQYYLNTMRKYFVDVTTGDTSPIPDGWDPQRTDQVMKTFGLKIVARQERRVRWRTTVDKYVMAEGWSPYRRFNIVPFFPYFRRGKPFGLVRNLISPQELLNKSISQELHVINTTANSGWIVEEGSLVGMTTEELKKQGAQSGLVLSIVRGTAAPTKIQPNQIPTGLDRLTQHAGVFFRDISGVSDSMLGQPGREISGEALQRKEMRGLVQLDTVFDNLALSRQYRAELMLEIFQDYYRDTRIFKIIASGEDGEQMPEDVKLNYVTASNEIANDVTVGEYSVVVSSRPARDVEDDTQFQQMVQMREAGVLVPDWAIMEASSLDKKNEIAQWIRQTQGATAPTEEEIQQQQMQQELIMRRQMADIAEVQSNVQRNMAQADLFIAQATSAGMGMQSEAAKLGAKLRADMEAQILDLEKQRGDLAARITIAQQKNETARQQALLGALTDRLKTESQERIAAMQAAAATNAARSKANTH